MGTINEALEAYGLTKRPAFGYMRCLNTGLGDVVCHACVEACPQHIYPDVKNKKPDFRSCLDCGACAAPCPALAIRPSVGSVRRFLKALSGGSPVELACAKEEGSWPLQPERLDALSWEQLALAALKGELVISLRPCADCPEQRCKEQLLARLDRVRRCLGDELFFDRVRLLEQGEAYSPRTREISRRELFGLFRQLDTELSLKLLPEWSEKDPPELFYRAMLRDELNKLREELGKDRALRPVLPLPAFNEHCYRCGTCVQQCPSQALKLLPSADGQSFTVAIEAWRCSGCGKCVRACKEKAIDGLRELRVPHLGAVALKRCPVFLCTSCGKPRKPGDEDGLCGFCRMRKQAAERAAARKRGEIKP